MKEPIIEWDGAKMGGTSSNGFYAVHLGNMGVSVTLDGKMVVNNVKRLSTAMRRAEKHAAKHQNP